MNKRRPRLSVFALIATVMGLSLGAQANTERCDSEACKAQMERLAEFGQNGSPEALAISALAYATGDGLEKDEDRARQMIKESIRLKSAVGMYIKSKWRAQGFLFEKDLERSEYFLRRSAELGYEVANYEMAARLLSQGGDASEKGLEYLDAAAGKGYIPALYVQARMMEDSATTPDELATVATVYAEVARKRHRDAGQRLRGIIQTLEDEPAADEKVVASLREMRDMEVITVVGQDPGMDNSLERINLQLETMGVYDGKRAGSRIRRQRACGDDMGCKTSFMRGGENTPYTGGTVADLFGVNP